MMEPKEKAKDLVNKFMNCDNMIFLTEGAKQCALIAVDEILNLNDIDEEYSFYIEVKKEIEKL